jgi:DNA-directed RNA polymerase specialized sigma24 family protein
MLASSDMPEGYPKAMKRLCDEDCSVLERIQRGGDQAIALLYDRYSSVVYSIALRVLRDPVLAQQVLLDIFMEIWRSPSCFMKIAGNLSFSLVMAARSRSVAMLIHKPASDLDLATPEWVANYPGLNMTRDEACAEIDKMPVERRMMLERVSFEGSKKITLAVAAKSSLETKETVTSIAVSKLAGTGLEVIDLESDPAFARRRLHVRDAVMHLQGMNRLARIFVENPTTILQELVTAAVELCGADSAGISVVQEESTDDDFYRWVATAGQYSGFLNAKLPRYPSACGVTLERGCPQIFRVAQRFFDLMGVQAPTVTDGLLLPWQVEEARGTIWIMAHGRDEAFDGEDCQMMQVLANFAATGVKLQQQQKLLIEQAKTAGETAIANSLAHQINDPLQGLMQTVYHFGQENAKSGVFAQQVIADLLRLSNLVKRLQSFPE